MMSLFNAGRFKPYAQSVLRFLFVSILMGLLAAPVWAEPETISLDQEVSGEIAPGEERIYQVADLSPGQRVYLQRTAGTNTTQLSWSIEDRFGRVIEANPTSINDLGPVALMGGDYYLTVRGRTPTSSGSFSFILHAVTDTTSSLALDVTDSRSFSGVGATHRFDLLQTQPGPVRLFFGLAEAIRRWTGISSPWGPGCTGRRRRRQTIRPRPGRWTSTTARSGPN